MLYDWFSRSIANHSLLTEGIGWPILYDSAEMVCTEGLVPPGEAPQMRIAVDAMGGDYAPAEIVKGAVEEVQENRTNITLVGKEAVIRPLLQSYPRLG
ncbi:MAG: hypothetical protein V1737_04125, partial [Chloroflexota bacterium]